MSTSTIELTAARVVNVDQTPPILMCVYDSTLGKWFPVDSNSGVIKVSGGGGGGGGLVQIDQTTPGNTNGVVVNSGTVAVSNFPVSYPVTGTFWQATQPVSIAASVAVTGPLTDVQLRASVVPVSAVQSGVWTTGRTWTLASGTDNVAAVQSGVWNIGAVTSITNPVAVTGTFWQATQPVSIAATVTTSETKASGSSVASVAASVASVTLLASNANRKQAAVYNDSTANLYLKLGAAATTSSFTVKMIGGAYYELPNSGIYTGIIDGVWDSATGNARVTELT